MPHVAERSRSSPEEHASSAAPRLSPPHASPILHDLRRLLPWRRKYGGKNPVETSQHMPFELAGSLDADGKGVVMRHDHDEDDEPVWLWAEHEVRVCEPCDMPSCAPSCESALFLFLRNSKGAAVASGETELRRILDEKVLVLSGDSGYVSYPERVRTCR